MTSMRTKLTIAAAAVALTAGGAGVAVAGSGTDDGEGTATGPGADKARAAAVQLVPGRPNSVERDTENGATWEVEITRSSDRATVDVRLDEDYGLVVVEGDAEPE